MARSVSRATRADSRSVAITDGAGIGSEEWVARAEVCSLACRSPTFCTSIRAPIERSALT